jgi:hypothetical protein
MIAPNPREEFCERLAEMRGTLVDAMARDGYSAGAGAMLAGIAAALDEAQGAPWRACPPAGSRIAGPNVPAPVAPPPRAGGGDYDAAADSLGGYNDALAALRCRHRRAIVADDGREIRPALYGPDDALAGELIAAARRLARQGEYPRSAVAGGSEAVSEGKSMS